jgi:uncharacterized membrane protein HdeD (DUF308 family)
MTESQTNRPDPASSADLAQDGATAGQASVPPQGRGNSGNRDGSKARSSQGSTAQASTAEASTAQYERGRDGTADGSADMAGGPMGLGPALAKMAWPVAMLAALGTLAVGVMLLVWPTATLTIVAILIGAALLVSGVFRLFDGITAHGESGGMRAADVVIGLLAIVVGLYCLKHQSLTVLVLALVVGVYWVIHGIGDLITAATATGVPGRGLRAIGGVFSLAAGLVILFWPGVSLILLLTILGAWLLLYGVVLAVLAFRLRSEAKAGSARPAKPAPA